MSEASQSARGLRPALPLACRTWLRATAGADERHEADALHASCPRCQRFAAFRARMAPLLAEVPRPPAELASRAMVEGILARIVDDSAELMTERLKGPTASPAASQTWPDGLLDSPLASSTVPSPTPAASALNWAQVRHSILADVSARKGRLARRAWFGVLAAAGVVCSALVLSDGAKEPPTIVFTDLATMPGVEFSIVRYGALR